MHLYWIENFDYALMDILKDNWDSPLKYVVSLLTTSYNKNITKNKLKIVFNTYNFFIKITQLFL